METERVLDALIPLEHAADGVRGKAEFVMEGVIGTVTLHLSLARVRGWSSGEDAP